MKPSTRTPSFASLPAVALGLLVFLAVLLSLPGCTNPRDKESTLDSGTSLYLFSTYRDNGNGTMTDPNGLVWMRCAYGQVWDPNLYACTGTGSGTTFGAKSLALCTTAGYCTDLVSLVANAGPAFLACDGLDFAGSTAWRLPTIYELSGLGTGNDRKTLLMVFPNTPDDKYFWSGSQDVNDTKLSRAVSFAGTDFGADYGRTQTEANYVKCVH